MMDRTSSESPRRSFFRATPYLLIVFLLAPIYFNSFNADWQMDDRPNIIDNPGLRINDLSPQSLWGTFFANQGKETKLFRPLPCLTFALNWYVGRTNPLGYHLVNLAFHITTAGVLYLSIIKLLSLSNHSCKRDPAWIQNVALLTTVLWAIHPIQTQAVTYIVQRMAIMATFFYILGILSYLKARTATGKAKQWVYGGACLLCFIGGMGSKENTILLPITLLLVEWIFFRDSRLVFSYRPKMVLTGILVSIGLVGAVHFTFGFPWEYVLNGYNERPFSLLERVMTQPRIILMYLSQLFLPLPQRLSIAHDVTLSTSLLEPLTTLPAMAVVIGSIALAVKGAKGYPLLSFAVLFFFLNHTVESTVLPLELVFEHRNYLPSMFLFLPLAAGLVAVFDRLRHHSGFLYAAALGIVILVLVGLGLGTYTRNKAWATPQTLWTDAFKKAPGSIRPLVNLGIQLAWKDNPTPDNLRHALVLFQHSLNLVPNRTKEKSEILGNIAGVYFHQSFYEKSVELYRQALSIDPGFLKHHFDLINPLVMMGKFAVAEQHARYLTSKRPENPEYLNLLGFILLWQADYDQASICFQNALSKGLQKENLTLNMGVALTRSGYWERGAWFLRRAILDTRGDPLPVLAMIENRLRAGDGERAKAYARKLIETMPVPAIADRLNALTGDYRSAPISVDIILPVVEDAMICVLK